DDLLDHGRGLVGGGGLRGIDLLLTLHVLGGDIFPADVARIGGGDVHRDVLEQLLEVLSAGNEIALAVELDEYADLAAGVDVGAHSAFVSGARRLLLRGGHAPLAQYDESLLHIALGLLEGLEAVAHRRAGLLAELL